MGLAFSGLEPGVLVQLFLPMLVVLFAEVRVVWCTVLQIAWSKIRGCVRKRAARDCVLMISECVPMTAQIPMILLLVVQIAVTVVLALKALVQPDLVLVVMPGPAIQ